MSRISGEYQFNRNTYEGWVTVATKKRKNPAYRLWYSEELLYQIKDIFLMSYMRDIENKLRSEKTDIESEIPFWEFLDIEFDRYKRDFRFKAYYTQKPSFPELFKRLVGSPVLRKIDREIQGKDKDSIFKRDWKPRADYVTEIGATNVIYMLIDTKMKLFYVGEARDLVKRFNQGHNPISNWDYYRYDVLPKSLEKHRLEIERMYIRDLASLIINSKGIESMEISRYRLVNERIDK